MRRQRHSSRFQKSIRLLPLVYINALSQGLSNSLPALNNNSGTNGLNNGLNSTNNLNSASYDPSNLLSSVTSSLSGAPPTSQALGTTLGNSSILSAQGYSQMYQLANIVSNNSFLRNALATNFIQGLSNGLGVIADAKDAKVDVPS